MEDKSLKQQNDNTGLIIVTILSVLFIFTILIWTYNTFNEADLTTRGTFGDMFGAANALFSGLAFVGIIVTILLQRNELALQRQELKDTREELKRTATAQENSERALRRQAENLKISAQLSALSTLITHYTNEANATHDIRLQTEYRETKQKYIVRIQQILERKENSISSHAGR